MVSVSQDQNVMSEMLNELQNLKGLMWLRVQLVVDKIAYILDFSADS